jgi:cysteinyl-tRNA synthetase
VAELPPEALAKARARDAARAARDWATADALRAELQADGWIVEDGPDGTTIRR